MAAAAAAAATTFMVVGNLAWRCVEPLVEAGLRVEGMPARASIISLHVLLRRTVPGVQFEGKLRRSTKGGDGSLR